MRESEKLIEQRRALVEELKDYLGEHPELVDEILGDYRRHSP
jgi:hypothetical protein